MKRIKPFILFLFSSSFLLAQNANEICPLNIGLEVPAAKVLSIEGEEVDVKTLTSSQPTIIVFYRGGWCPYCNAHLAELQEIKLEIKQYGYQIVAISADKFEMLNKTVEKKELNYKLYSDNGLEASNAFGITFTPKESTITLYRTALSFSKWSGENQAKLPVPAIFVINKGKIVYRYVNPDYKQRISSEMLLAALKSIK